MIAYKKEDTSIARLRNISKLFKSEWCKLHSRINRRGGLAPSKKPLWFEDMDQVFSETNAEIGLSFSAHKTSFVQNDGDSGRGTG